MNIERILVTGSAGFIGFHLSKSLLDVGYEVLGIDNLNDYYDPKLKLARLEQLKPYKNFKFEKIDISDRENLNKAFTDFKPQKVVNLAAQAGVRYSIENPYAYMDSNLVGFLNVLELCRHNKVEGLIYASSSSVYGGNTKNPFSVEDRVDNPISLYAATKKANELIANTYSHLYGLRSTGLRFFTVYGPWGRPDMAYYLFTEKIANGETIPVYNNGNMKRDFTYIDDIIAGTRSAIDKNYPCEIFNLGNHRSEELMDVVHLIEENLDKKAIINFQPMQPGDVKESFADIEKSTKLLGYKPTTNVDIGIRNFINWYNEYTT
ncbi:GDP-mannose 4,6-dehydratase [candidate division KSB1 bacterium]|nr:GDP-mannose 4,6-dehydratase [candidate division KSB1 bacterium]